MLILIRSAIWQKAELSKCIGGWLATASECVKEKRGREGGRWAVGWKWTICTRKKYPHEQNSTNVIVMVHSENYNTSQLSIFLCSAEHFTTRQFSRVTANNILNATLVHYRCTHTLRSPFTPCMHIFHIFG